MGWIDSELVLVTIAAMLSPTTLTFSSLVLVLSDRPFRTGLWFYTGALGATLAIGVIAAFVLGDAAASSDPSTPKTWVAIVDLVAAGLLFAFVARAMRRPRDPKRAAAMMERMRQVTGSPAIAIAGAGATLANPGGFIPLALKEISELDPSRAEYVADWLFFSLVSLLPLAVALVLLVVARDWTRRKLESSRGWLERNARTIAAVILVALAAALARNGIAGLTA
jgi:threonine/homoserine/homoserine lactone efflux protein